MAGSSTGLLKGETGKEAADRDGGGGANKEEVVLWDGDESIGPIDLAFLESLDGAEPWSLLEWRNRFLKDMREGGQDTFAQGLAADSVRSFKGRTQSAGQCSPWPKHASSKKQKVLEPCQIYK